VPPAAGPASAAHSATQSPEPVASLTSVDLDGNTLAWSVTSDLLEAGMGPTAPYFVPEVETDGTAYLLFGDGINGLVPEPGATFTATYRVGNGTSGNVARAAITLLDMYGAPAGVAGVTNPMPAWGGVDPETVEHVRQSAPVAFRSTQARAVTAADYQALAATYPGVQRAAARLRWTGSWNTVFITVERTGEAALDAAFIAGLETYLDGYRMAGVDLAVEDGIAVPLLLRMSVCVQSAYVAADVQQALLALFNAGVEPDGTPGLFSPDRLDLGQPFYLSPLIAAAQAVDGVASAQVTAFERQDRAGSDGLATGVLIPQPLEFFALDNDPSRPERGRFELTVGGGL
jgi:predicted phage baseplate assembly protein